MARSPVVSALLAGTRRGMAAPHPPGGKIPGIDQFPLIPRVPPYLPGIVPPDRRSIPVDDLLKGLDPTVFPPNFPYPPRSFLPGATNDIGTLYEGLEDPYWMYHQPHTDWPGNKYISPRYQYPPWRDPDIKPSEPWRRPDPTSPGNWQRF